jgi:predicted dehydrogenase
MEKIRLLVLGTGSMANAHADAFAAIPGVSVVAGVDTRPAQLAEFCRKHDVPNSFPTLEEALAWGEFDAATNVTPDPVHHPTTLKLIAAGKHVMCEKPLATSYPLAQEMADAAKAAGLVNMVNLTYRNGAALQRAAAMVQAGEIGELRHFEASYLQSWLTQPAWGVWQDEPRWLWRLSTAHGSKGTLGDIGIHILDYATFIAGEAVAELGCNLVTFHKAPGDKVGEYVLDANDAFTMQLALAGGAVGTVSATRMSSGHMNDLYLRLYGLKGGVEVSFERGISRLRTCLGPATRGPDWTEVACPAVPTNYQRFIGAIRGTDPGLPDFARGAELQSWLDLAERSDAAGARMLPTG